MTEHIRAMFRVAGVADRFACLGGGRFHRAEGLSHIRCFLVRRLVGDWHGRNPVVMQCAQIECISVGLYRGDLEHLFTIGVMQAREYLTLLIQFGDQSVAFGLRLPSGR